MPLVKTKTRLDHEVENLIASANKHQPFASAIGHFVPHLAEHLAKHAGHDVWDRLSPRGQAAVLTLALKKHVDVGEIARALVHHEPDAQMANLAEVAHERSRMQRADGGSVDLPTFARGAADDNTSGDRSGPAIGDMRAPIDPNMPDPQDSPRSVRNNNPGNLVNGDFARSQPGYAGDDGRFARFETPDTGQAATGALLDKYADQGINTPHQIISKFAPPNENDTRAYAAHVANTLGVGPHDRIDMSDPGIRAIVTHAIRHYEGGRPADRYYDKWNSGTGAPPNVQSAGNYQRGGYAGGGNPTDDLIDPTPIGERGGLLGGPDKSGAVTDQDRIDAQDRLAAAQTFGKTDPAASSKITPPDPDTSAFGGLPPSRPTGQSTAPDLGADAARELVARKKPTLTPAGNPTTHEMPEPPNLPPTSPHAKPDASYLLDSGLEPDVDTGLRDTPVVGKTKAQPRTDASYLLGDDLENIDTGLRDTPAVAPKQQPAAPNRSMQASAHQPVPQQPAAVGQTYSDPVTNFLDSLTGVHRQQPNTGGGAVGFVNDLAGFESGRRNIVGLGQARGYYQITDPTWHDFAPRAGVDLRQYPTAMSAPQEVQAAVASNIPMGRWAPKTLDKMRGEGWQIDPSKTMGENAAQNNQPMQQAQRAVTNTGAAFGATVNAAGQGLAGGLGNAKQLLADRGSQMWNFMAQNGYANHGEAWCGEFTGAVVHSQGVQPPKGAAVASNWLNWGTHVDPGDVRPGDIAVQKYSRYGGAAEAGKPGSHVGIVQDTGNGSFNLLAGNQGAPVTARNTRDFEFRRPPAGQGGGGGQSAQQQPQQGGGGGQSAQQGASAEDKALTITNPFTQGVDALGKLGQQANQGFSDNRSWLIPLLSGIGKMASSNSPYFGTALLQGLGGGAEAWAHEQQAQAGLGETQARTGEIRSRSGEIDARTQHQLIENSHGVLFTAPGSNMPMIHYVDSQGRIGVMDYGSYQQRAGSEKLRWATPDEVARYSKGGMQPAQPSPVVNPTAYPAGGGGGSSLPVFTMPPGVSGAPPVIGAPAPKVPLAPPPAPLPQAPSTQPAFGVGMSDASKADAASERPFVYGDPNSTQRKVGADWYQDAQERSRAAEDNRFITRELAKNTGAMLNHTGVAVTGALGNERAGVLQKVQTVLKGLGWTTDLPTSADSDAEINRKLTTFFGAQQAQGAGQHSHQAMTQIMSALPGMHLTPETNAAIVSQILGIQQRDRDMGVYANQWNGGAPNSATHHLAASGFRRDSPDYMNETNYLNWLLLKKPAQFQQLMDHEGISQADFEKRMQSLPVPKGMPKPPPNISRYFY